jgi:hypothetical protein
MITIVPHSYRSIIALERPLSLSMRFQQGALTVDDKLAPIRRKCNAFDANVAITFDADTMGAFNHRPLERAFWRPNYPRRLGHWRNSTLEPTWTVVRFML